jgi:hypothetical protein
MAKPIVYMAGKISKNDWRRYILGGVRSGSLTPAHPEEKRLFDPTFTLVYPDFLYGGPFFLSCDHGCAHGPASHGVDATGDSVCISAGSLSITPQKIFAINLLRINRADYVFAFINEMDCYGTLVELGLASQAGKHITVAFGANLSDKDMRELWMVRQCANAGVIVGWQPEEAWEMFLRQPPPLKLRAS